MINYFNGTVFNAPVKTFVNTVNCSGVMGAGIALEFKLRYPKMYDDYVEKCKNRQMKIGFPRIYEYSDNLWIMNFPTKVHWKFPSRLDWIDKGLKYFAQNYMKKDIKSIAFPKLGTSNGGLKWEDVKQIMEKYLKDINDIDIYICLDEKKEAEGIEKDMVDSLNNSTLDDFINIMQIPKRQSEIITQNIPYDRFWKVSKLNGIGEKSYERLFEYFYNSSNNIKALHTSSKNNINDSGQLSFFNIP